MNERERAETAAKRIKETCGGAEVGLILGSGLSDLLSPGGAVSLPYSDIPGFPLSTAPGHKSEWVCGEMCGKRVCVMRGRFHAYEGYPSKDIVLPVRVMKLLGVTTLLITCATGAVNPSLRPGDLMLISDHIAFGGENPLTGENDDFFGPRFPDMSAAYSPVLREKAKSAAKAEGIDLKEGVYIRFPGPSYETPAEIRAARVLGADVVGMSTVPEVIAARHCSIDVAAIAAVTNMAAGILEKPITHEEVLRAGEAVRDKLAALIRGILLAL